MAAFNDLGELVNRLTGGNSGTPEFPWWHKEARVGGAAAVATIVGQWTSLWEYEGSPSHGAVPGAVAAPDNTTAGGLKQVDPTGGRQKWLSAMFGAANTNGTLLLYDRLLHIGGLSGTVTTAQNVGGALTRYATTEAAGNMVWAEIYTLIGVTGTTITMSYTDESGNAGATSQAVVFGATNRREVGRIVPMSLASGDSGVRAVASCTVLATTGTAGNFGITVARPLMAVAVNSAGFGAVRSFVDGPMPEIKTDACLALAWFAGTVTPPVVDFMPVMSER